MRNEGQGMKNGEWGGGIRDKGRERRNEDEGGVVRGGEER